MFRQSKMSVLALMLGATAAIAAPMPYAALLPSLSDPKPLELLGNRSAKRKEARKEADSDKLGDLYKDVETDLHDLQTQMRSLHETHVKDLAATRLSGEDLLDEQQMVADRENSTNAHIQAVVDSVELHIFALRQRASVLQMQIGSILDDFEALNMNVSLALEFTEAAVRTQEERRASPEMEVLHELAMQREHVSTSRSGPRFWARIYNNRAGARAGRPGKEQKHALLQTEATSSSSKTAETTPTGLFTQYVAHMALLPGAMDEHVDLQATPARLKELVQEPTVEQPAPKIKQPHAETLTRLQKMVHDLSQMHDRHIEEIGSDLEARYQEGAEAIAKLKLDQEQLNATQDKLAVLAPKVVDSVRELDDTRTYLVQQNREIRSFLANLSYRLIAVDESIRLNEDPKSEKRRERRLAMREAKHANKLSAEHKDRMPAAHKDQVHAAHKAKDNTHAVVKAAVHAVHKDEVHAAPKDKKPAVHKDQVHAVHKDGVPAAHKDDKKPAVHKDGSKSLLQVDAVQAHALPTMEGDPELEANSAYKAIAQHMAELENELLHDRVEAASNLMAEQKKLEAKLMEQCSANVYTAHENTNLMDSLKTQSKFILVVESQARQVNRQVKFLSDSVISARDSLSAVRVTILETLRRATVSRDHGSRVIDELETQDQLVKKKQEHAGELAEVEDAWDSLTVPPDSDGNDKALGDVSLLVTGVTRAVTKGPQGKAKASDAVKSDVLPYREGSEGPAPDGDDFARDPVELDENLSFPVAITSAGDALTNMEMVMKSINRAQAATVDELDQKFKAASESCGDSAARLAKERDTLVGMTAAANSLTKRLKKALRSATGQKDTLQSQARSIRAYSGQLAADTSSVDSVTTEQAASLSFLQMSSRVFHRHSASIPGEEVEDPEQSAQGSTFGSQTFRNIASRATALQQKLKDMESQGKQTLVAHKEEYKRKLVDMTDANQKLSLNVQQLEGENRVLNTSILRLRRQARVISKDIDTLNVELATLQGNLSKAADFAGTTMQNVAAKRGKELDILNELDMYDRENSAKEAKKRRLGEIAASLGNHPHASLLQMTRDDSPQSLLRGLEGGIGEMSDEYATLERKAKEDFQKVAMQKREEHARLLSEKGAKLEEKHALQSKLGRLTAAITLLEDMRNKLEARSESLRTFAQRLSGRPAPVLASKQPEPEAAQEEGAEAKVDGRASNASPVHAAKSVLQSEDSKPPAAGKFLSWFTR